MVNINQSQRQFIIIIQILQVPTYSTQQRSTRLKELNMGFSEKITMRSNDFKSNLYLSKVNRSVFRIYLKTIYFSLFCHLRFDLYAKRAECELMS